MRERRVGWESRVRRVGERVIAVMERQEESAPRNFSGAAIGGLV